MHHPSIRVTISITAGQAYEPAAVRVVEERTVPSVDIDAGGPSKLNWFTLARVLDDYVERAVAEARGQARELADYAPDQTGEEVLS